MDQKPCLSAPSTVCNALPISKPDTKISIDNSWLNMLLEITIQLVLVLFNLFPFACSIPHKLIRFFKINGAVFELKTITISWWWKQLKPQVLYLKSTLSQHKTSTEKAHEEICKCHLFKTISKWFAMYTVVQCAKAFRRPPESAVPPFAWFEKTVTRIQWMKFVKPFWKKQSCCKYI